jgi:hypothetical protein
VVGVFAVDPEAACALVAARIQAGVTAMKIHMMDALRRVLMGLAAVVITAASFAAVNAGVMPAGSSSAVGSRPMIACAATHAAHGPGRRAG